MAICRKRKYTM